MRILFVVPEPPSRVRVRSFGFLQALKALGHEVTVATTVSGPREASDVDRLRQGGMHVVAEPLPRSTRLLSLMGAALGGRPLQAAYTWQPKLARHLLDLVHTARGEGRPFDVAHVEHLRGAHYALRLRGYLPVVWDSVDCITALFEQAVRLSGSRKGRLYSARDLGRTRWYEGWLARQFDGVVVTSEADRDALAALADATRGRRNGRVFKDTSAGRVRDWRVARGARRPTIAIVPNGVDSAFFSPPDGVRLCDTVLMTGKMSYHANVTAARYLVDDVMPHVWAERPEAHVVLAGARPAREVRALADRCPGRVTVTGYVEDLRLYLRSAAVAVAPMVYGAGIQNKVLEAMACATPMVATSVATRSLGAEPGRDFILADYEAAFAAGAVTCLGDSRRARLIGRAGRAYVKRHHRWDTVARALETVHSSAIGRAARRARGSTAGTS